MRGTVAALLLLAGAAAAQEPDLDAATMRVEFVANQDIEASIIIDSWARRLGARAHTDAVRRPRLRFATTTSADLTWGLFKRHLLLAGVDVREVRDAQGGLTLEGLPFPCDPGPGEGLRLLELPVAGQEACETLTKAPAGDGRCAFSPSTRTLALVGPPAWLEEASARALALEEARGGARPAEGGRAAERLRLELPAGMSLEVYVLLAMWARKLDLVLVAHPAAREARVTLDQAFLDDMSWALARELARAHGVEVRELAGGLQALPSGRAAHHRHLTRLLTVERGEAVRDTLQPTLGERASACVYEPGSKTLILVGTREWLDEAAAKARELEER